MANGNIPGNGKTDPFGTNGGGGGGSMAQGNNFVENARGTNTGGARRSFVEADPRVATQKRTTDADEEINSGDSKLSAGASAAEDPAITPSQDAGNPIGVGSPGLPGVVPFRLNGGSSNSGA